MLAWEVEGLGNKSSFSAGLDWLSWLLLWFILGFSDSDSMSVSGVDFLVRIALLGLCSFLNRDPA